MRLTQSPCLSGRHAAFPEAAAPARTPRTVESGKVRGVQGVASGKHRGVRESAWASREWRQPAGVASGETAWRPGRGVRQAAWRPPTRVASTVASAMERGVRHALDATHLAGRKAPRLTPRCFQDATPWTPCTLLDATHPKERSLRGVVLRIHGLWEFRFPGVYYGQSEVPRRLGDSSLPNYPLPLGPCVMRRAFHTPVKSAGVFATRVCGYG